MEQTKTKVIIDMLFGDVELRSKRELIKKVIKENLPQINDLEAIQDGFERFWHEEKIVALAKICDEEHLAYY